ncbi:MAG: UbiA family prenyltransferase [Phycisphaeraceae bacterium]
MTRTADHKLHAPLDPTGIARWWVYQRERFPLLIHGPLIAAFSFCAVSLSTMLRGGEQIRPASAGVAFVTCLLFFLQLRIADEFKDFAEDLRYRPYRPVPRGLVTLRELGGLFVIAATVQLLLALWLAPVLLILLAIAWAYLAAMTCEFGLRDHLSNRPLLYLISHMLIMPLVDLYATGTDWLVVGAGVPAGITWFLAASFFNGMTIDIGRKIRAPADEEPGVRTYTMLWGRSVAVVSWWAVVIASMLCALGAARRLDFVVELSLLYLPLVALCGWGGIVFLRRPHPGSGKRIELLTALCTLGLYLGLGVAPLIARSLG